MSNHCTRCYSCRANIQAATSEIRSLLNQLQARPGFPGARAAQERIKFLQAELKAWRSTIADHEMQATS